MREIISTLGFAVACLLLVNPVLGTGIVLGTSGGQRIQPPEVSVVEPEPESAPDPQEAEDRELLARVVYAEAGTESFECKKAVAEVVMNRIESGYFPDSIPEVIYEPGQFETVPILPRAKPREEEYAAVDEALAGIDPVLPGPKNSKLVVFFSLGGEKNAERATKIGTTIFCYAHYPEK